MKPTDANPSQPDQAADPPRMATFTGRAHVYGDNIDTDRIIPGKYTKTLELSDLARHVLEDLDPDFSRRVQPGDLLVAGRNFGCGSSREQAPVALKAAGVAAVIAQSFARLFFRNAINVGLPLVEAPHHAITGAGPLSVDLEAGLVTDHATGQTYAATRLPAVMVAILRAGGLVNYLVKHGDYRF